MNLFCLCVFRPLISGPVIEGLGALGLFHIQTEYVYSLFLFSRQNYKSTLVLNVLSMKFTHELTINLFLCVPASQGCVLTTSWLGKLTCS